MILRCGPAHAAALSAIHAAGFPPGESWDAQVMAAQLGQPGIFAFIAGAGGMVLARSVLDEAEILTLAVAPDARRRGTGRDLLRHAMAEAQSRGAVKMFLEVSAANAAARALYQSCGFTRAGLRRRYYADGSDALLLSRPLSPA